MTTLLATLALVGVAVLLMGVKVFFVRGGRFPSSHVHDNEALRSRGITCAQEEFKQH